MSSYSDTLIPIIRKAGEIILSAHDIESGDNVEIKPGSANFVTVYDIRVQDFIISEIKKAFPSAVFIAEEKDNDEALLFSEYCFIIDPIDGTTNFIHDYKISCISVALFKNGSPEFGAIYDPYLNELFYAQKGGGSYVNGRRTYVSERDADTSILAYGTAPYYKDTLADKTFALCRELFSKCADVRRCGSAALDLAYLSAGRCDLFFEFILSPWDIAAAFLLVTEAGGIMTDMGGNEIDFSSTSSVIASNQKNYRLLLDTVQKY